jgi:hypothetical protein
MVVLSIPVTFRRRVSELKKGCEKGIEMMVVGVLFEEGPGFYGSTMRHIRCSSGSAVVDRSCGSSSGSGGCSLMKLKNPTTSRARELGAMIEASKATFTKN